MESSNSTSQEREMQLMQEENVPSFLPTEDPLGRLNKAMELFRSAITSRYPPATIQEGKVDIGKTLDVSLVVIESSDTELEVQVESSRSGNDTDADDANIRPQPEFNNEGEVDQYTKECQVKSRMRDSLVDNKTIEFSNQSLESENILLKKIVAQFQKDFSRMEAHCIALELKYQNHSIKSGQHGQILNEASNKAKMKTEIDAFETINIELKHSVATLLKENETLKKHYKDLYDSIKITRSKTIEQTTSLLANNADLKAHIQEKVFAIAALKNKLRKLKGNSVDTKFVKTSVLGKPVLQPFRNQSVVRQLSAFKSERPKISKPRFASQVDVEKDSNSSKNMPRFSSNDMVHNHYLEEAKKMTQEKDRNSKSSVIHSTRLQNTTNGSKQKPRSNNQTTRSFPASQISWIFTGHRFSPNKSSVVYEKMSSPRSDLRWKPTGRILNTIGLKWVPTGKIFTSCKSKADSESTHGSKVHIFKICECKQTLDLSVGTSLTGQQKQIIDISVVVLVTPSPAAENIILSDVGSEHCLSSEKMRNQKKNSRKRRRYEVDIREDKNEPELTFPYEETDPLNPLNHSSDSKIRKMC
ncbi:hypothetical protein Tco_0527438 [Tanacetum coccineum]